MLKVASSRMFKDAFLNAAILTLQDPVPSVRMRACRMLPQLKYAIKLPDDLAILEKINHLTTQRLNDNVREVAAAAHSLSDGLKNSLRNAINDREIPSEQAISQEEFDKIDKQREEEEWNMLPKEEQEEKKKLDDMLRRLKVDGASRKSAAAVSGGMSGSSPPVESAPRHHSKSSGSGRQSVTSNGPRNSFSSSSSGPPNSSDPSSRASVSKPHRQPSSNLAMGSKMAAPHVSTHPNSISPPSSTTQLSATGQHARRRDTSFVGVRSSGYRLPAAVSATIRPSSPTVNLRPQTPVASVAQDFSETPGPPVQSSHAVGQRILPARSSKPTHVPRKNSNP